MQDYSSLSVLIVDPNSGMRGSMHNMLNQSLITKIDYAVSSGTAIRKLSKQSYDIILCEYDLAGDGQDGQDGQQLLEDLRHHKLIGLWTIFIMITSERVYSKVVSAAELSPTDYILKPFTVDVLTQRIGKAVERRTAFLPTYQLIGQGNSRAAIKSCAAAEASHPRYGADFARLRAELHASLGELPEAEQIYQAVLAASPLGWARLGLAKTLFAQQRFDVAQETLTALVTDHPKFMAAYDWLAKCHETNADPARAQTILEEAVSISPHMVRRLRRLGEVALEAGDVLQAERAFKQVVAKAKYSEFRDAEDHVNLVRALVKKGDVGGVGGVIRDLEKSLRGNPNTEACRAISAAMLLEATGNGAAAVDQLNTAVSAVRDSQGLSSRLKISLAQACLSNQLDKAASELMLGVINDADSGVSMAQAMDVFVAAGRPDLAEGMGAQLKEQVQALMAGAAEKTAQGDHKGAVTQLLAALRKAPANVPVLFATTTAILRQLTEQGWDHPLGEHCHTQIAAIRQLEPAHPLLGVLADDYLAAKRKYGIAA